MKQITKASKLIEEGNDVAEEGFWESTEPGAELLFLANHELRLELEEYLGEITEAAKYKMWKVADTVRNAMNHISLVVTRLESEIYIHRCEYSREDMTRFAQQFGQLEEGLWSMYGVLTAIHDNLNKLCDKRHGVKDEAPTADVESK
jgi:hypothetical protein